ncbi:LuxR family transcriptional regulator [Intestinimonas butyriciproducens]|uniref:LuxR family transcriptional regulator n=1 Tax=Intestinimonas butyriciproducens TaxID=1297617 RepID=UPI00051CAAD7|nr:LuxR family transcriptional regulator [Intestinimonas butyriciproducens]
MPKRGFIETLGLYREAIRRGGQNGLPMRLRLFLFLILFLNTIMLGVLLILFASGVFRTGLREHRPVLGSELAHIAQDIYKSFGSVSVQATDLSKELSAQLERNMKEHGATAASLQESPDLLEHLLEDELGRLTGALEKSDASGVFLLLDATVNPALPDGDVSRACLYLKNMEPNIVNGMAANLRLGFGPMAIARSHGIHALPQWQMEMDVGEVSDFTEVMAVAKEQKLPFSRLYRWSKAMVLPGSSDRVMLCTVPLIASDGTVFGVCGFEVSEMLFKLSYAPEPAGYDHLFCLLSPLEENTLRLSGALFAGNFAAGPAAPEHTQIDISSGSGGFYSYRQPEKEGYAGLHETVSLYPVDSAYGNEQWAVALMMPDKGLNTLISARSRNLILGLLVLMLVNVGLASFISHRYIRPVAAALEHLKNPDPAAKTKIPEIDDLIEFLAAQDELPISGESKELPVQEHFALYQEFAKNIKSLSAAEKTVFDLYVKGHTAKEIAEILCLSINTIKTHNRRIYMKLNVTSRKELMVYIQMMEEVDCANAANK